MTTVTFVLLLFASGEAIEYTPYDKMSDCLAMKRKIYRNVGASNRFDEQWQCQKLKVVVSEGPDGKLQIDNIITED